MNKQVFFGFLFCSWIFGISLICLFPPLAEYKVADRSIEYLSQDSAPEFHLRNSSQTRLAQLELGINFLSSVVEFDFDPVRKLLVSAVSGGSIAQISSFFDAKILFKVFYETW